MAEYIDWLGEGGPAVRDDENAGPKAPAVTAEELERARQGRIKRNAMLGLDEAGNPLPAYGTPMSQGGTATGFASTLAPKVGTGAMQERSISQLGANDVPLVGGLQQNSIYQVHGSGTNGGTTPILRSVGQGRNVPLLGSGGGLMGQTSQGSQALVADIDRRAQASQGQLQYAADSMPGSPVNRPGAVQAAGDNAQNALGAAPTIDMGIADRQQGNVDAALGLQRRVVDASLAPADNTAVNAADAAQRSVFDKLLNGPSTTERIGSQVLRNQLALARSAAGGPGAVQAAMSQAISAAPELQAAATQAGVAEELQRTQAAGQAAGQLQQSAAQGQTAANTRLGVAANAASGNTQGALGAREQDVQIAQANQQAASQLLQNVSQLTGQQLELDQRNQELMGQMARDLAAQDFQWSKLSADQQQAEWDRWVKTYGIDQTVAAQIKVAAIAADKGIMDYVVPIIGSLATLGAGAL